MLHITSKAPFKRIRPMHLGLTDSRDDVVTQEQFLAEYHPSGHRIHSTRYYPNIVREEQIEITDSQGRPTGKFRTQYYEERMPRYAFAFQQIIATKQIVHLCGNDVQFDLLNKDSQQDESLLKAFKDGWSEKDMELAFFHLARSVKITGDGAIVGVLENGLFSWQAFSFLNGDTLYPHYDRKGKLALFARKFYGSNAEGENIAFLEVWDDKYYYLLQADSSEGKTPLTLSSGAMPISTEGFALIDKQPHGFPRIPVAYMRDPSGAAWTASQDSIEAYELSFSQMAHSNQAFGTPILFFKGDNHNCEPDLNGTIKTISMGKNDEAGYLKSQSAAESYEKQLAINYRMIYEQSFTVIPPELRSGDLPAAALKILYSPAYEKATIDCALFQDALSSLVGIFTSGYGAELKKTIEFSAIPLKCWLKPYVHINWTSTISDLAMAVQNGFISRETAAERITEYATPKEWDRISTELQQAIAEQKDKNKTK